MHSGVSDHRSTSTISYASALVLTPSCCNIELVRRTLYPPCQKDDHTMDDNTKEKELLSPVTATEGTSMSWKSNVAVDSHGKPRLHSNQEPKEPYGSQTNAPNHHRAITDMVFYGIGSVESSQNSRFQLALGLCLKEILQVTKSDQHQHLITHEELLLLIDRSLACHPSVDPDIRDNGDL